MGDGLEGLSRPLRNLWKHFIFQSTIDAIRDVNAQHDKNEISYATKVMIWCGMSLKLHGVWIIYLITSKELQVIVAKYNDNFEGAKVILGGPTMA